VNPLSIPPHVLARLRRVCLALPGASEKEAWGDPTWRVRERIFAMQKGNVEGHRPSLWLKAAPGAQRKLVDADPELYFVPPYVGSKGWIGVWLDGRRIDWAALEERIAESHALVGSRRRR
jgi:predicted DNA-binding protein (MmcQ/YjbR family)